MAGFVSGTWVRYAVVAVLLAALLRPDSSLANVYRCNVIAVQQLTEAGVLGETGWAKKLLQRYRSIIWDDVTGLLRGGPTEAPTTFDFIQRGNRDNSTIAIFIKRGSASTYVSLFRLETYDPALPFMLTENNTVFSGNCEQLG